MKNERHDPFHQLAQHPSLVAFFLCVGVLLACSELSSRSHSYRRPCSCSLSPLCHLVVLAPRFAAGRSLPGSAGDAPPRVLCVIPPFGVETTRLLVRTVPCLADAIRSLSRAFTSYDAREQQWQWIAEWEQEEINGDSIIQRETYLLEEVDSRQKAAVSSRLSHEKAREIEAWKQELSQINQRLWHHKQERAALLCRVPGGAWIREYYTRRQRQDKWWEDKRVACENKGGCCERDCICCDKVRQTMSGQRCKYEKPHSHCTTECGCCIRDRGFYKPDPRIK